VVRTEVDGSERLLLVREKSAEPPNNTNACQRLPTLKWQVRRHLGGKPLVARVALHIPAYRLARHRPSPISTRFPVPLAVDASW
jgi:hypothetical protein